MPTFGGVTGRVYYALAQALPAGTFDAVERIATAVPIRVLLRILGIPRADEDLMIKLGDRMIAGTDPDLGDEGTGDDRYRLLPFRSPAALEMRDYSAWFRDAARQRGGDTSLLARLAPRSPRAPTGEAIQGLRQ